MKKLFAVLLAAAMTMSVFVFTANAADNEWEVYASVGKYDDEPEDPDDLPKEPGMQYTDSGVQMYSATSEQLDAMNANAWGGLQLKDKVKLTDGFTMSVVIDKYTEKADDKWIAFCLWTQPKATPADTKHGKGWFVLCRPNGANMTLLSFIDEPTNLQAQPNITLDIYGGEALVLDVRKEDGKMKVYVNDQDMKCEKVFDYFEDGEAYVSVVLHQANRDEIAATVIDVNGVKPTGTESQVPYVPESAKPREIGPEVAENEPCYLWNAERVKKGNPGSGLSSIMNDDGSLHISFTNDNASQINPTVKDMYDAEEFPVWAIKFKNLDELIDSSSLWYAAGEVHAAKNGCTVYISWADCDYESDDGWAILTYNLDGEPEWEGTINSFRLDLTSEKDFEETDTFDIDWIGFFRSEKEAYAYAGMSELYAKLYDRDATTTAADTEGEVTGEGEESGDGSETEAVTDVETVVVTDEEGNVVTDEEGKAVVTKEAVTDAETEVVGSGNGKTGLIIAIIAGVAVVAAVAVVLVLMKKKKGA